MENIGFFSAHEEGDLGHSSQVKTVVVLFTKAVPVMIFSKSLYGVFCYPTVVRSLLEKRRWLLNISFQLFGVFCETTRLGGQKIVAISMRL